MAGRDLRMESARMFFISIYTYHERPLLYQIQWTGIYYPYLVTTKKDLLGKTIVIGQNLITRMSHPPDM
jgi:hypothetical protein